MGSQDWKMTELWLFIEKCHNFSVVKHCALSLPKTRILVHSCLKWPILKLTFWGFQNGMTLIDWISCSRKNIFCEKKVSPLSEIFFLTKLFSPKFVKFFDGHIWHFSCGFKNCFQNCQKINFKWCFGPKTYFLKSFCASTCIGMYWNV